MQFRDLLREISLAKHIIVNFCNRKTSLKQAIKLLYCVTYAQFYF